MEVLSTKNAPDQRTATVRLEQKKMTETGQFEGYGSVFGIKDSYGEIVAAGAFTASLQAHRENGTLPAMLWQHDPHTPIGTYVEMYEDDRGLFVRGQLELDVQKGREAHKLLKSGAVNGLSIGFVRKKSEFDEDTKIRTLTEIDLWECSLVTFPANASARVSGTKAFERISSLADWKGFEKHLREDGGFSHETATAMVAAAKRIRDGEREAQSAKATLKSSSYRLLSLLNN